MPSIVSEHVEKTKGFAEVFARYHWLQWIYVVFLVYLLLVAVALIGSGFQIAAGDHAKQLFAFANNPITGLVIGIIATALVQSSSTVTSIIVGLVAGGLPVITAIPMVMGANIGTTITNTIVSLGHVKEGAEFRRAFAAATIHDVFNLLSVIIFLPLEIAFGFLDKISAFLASILVGGDPMSIKGFNFVTPLVKMPIEFVQGVLLGWLPDVITGITIIAIGIIMIFLVITFLGRLLKILNGWPS